MRGVLRALKEIGRRTVVGRFLGDLGSPGNNVYTRYLALDLAELASADGLAIPRSAGALHCHPFTFAGCKAEVVLGLSAPGSEEEWAPLNRSQVLSAPNGESFDGIRVRLRPDSSFDGTKQLVLVFDPAPYGAEAMVCQPPTPEVDLLGGAAATQYIIRRSDGTTAIIEGADGSVAGRAYPIFAGLDLANVGRAVQVASAALAATLAPSGGTMFAAAFGYLYDEVGATWRRVVSDMGVAGTGVLRVVGAATATAAPVRHTAVAASSVCLAANARRCSAVITNMADPATPTEGVYLDFGATLAAAATGYWLGPGQSLTITTVQAVNVIRQTGDVALSIVQESK